MDADERDICNYLRSWPGQFISAREISRRASGKKRFRAEPNWAAPVLSRLVERLIIESDATGHYRLLRKERDLRPKKWLSPEIKKILQDSGRDFAVFEIEDEEETEEKEEEFLESP